MKSLSGYETSTCEIQLLPNSGWASKGSTVTYQDYPNVTDPNDKYSYVDRYKYGVKFKFIVSGMMGKFNINNLVNHLVSGLVLVNTSSVIVCLIALYLLGSYSNKFKKMKYSDIDMEESSNTEQRTEFEDTLNTLENTSEFEDTLNTLENTSELKKRKVTTV